MTLAGSRCQTGPRGVSPSGLWVAKCPEAAWFVFLVFRAIGRNKVRVLTNAPAISSLEGWPLRGVAKRT